MNTDLVEEFCKNDAAPVVRECPDCIDKFIFLAKKHEAEGALLREALTKIALKGYQAALADDLPGSGKILAVDEPLGTSSRPDLVVRYAEGIAVWDTKVTLGLDPRYLPKRIQEYDTDWQLWQYAWEVGEYFGEPVVYAGVQLIILTPKTRVERIPVKIDPTRLAMWLKTAEQVWSDMGSEDMDLANRSTIHKWDSCHGKFGRCVFYDPCHIFHGDETQISQFFTRKEPRGSDTA